MIDEMPPEDLSLHEKTEAEMVHNLNPNPEP